MAIWTVHVTLPVGVTEKEIVNFLREKVGPLHSWNFPSTRKRSFLAENLGYGTLQFELREDAERACELSADNSLILKSTNLVVNPARFELKRLPTHDLVRWTKAYFSGGCLVCPTRFKRLWAPEVGTVTELDFGAKLLRLLFQLEDAWEYKMEFPFKDNLKIIPLLGEDKQSRSFLLKPGFAPRVYMRRVRSPVNTGIADLDEVIKLGQTSNKNICNIQDVEDPWIRTGDFLPHRPVSQCQQYVLIVSEVTDEMYKNAIKNLGDYNVVAAPLNEKTPPSENERRLNLVLEDHDYYALPDVVAPVLQCPYVPFEIVFKLNGLVQSGKLSGPCVTPDFLVKLSASYNYPTDWVMQGLHEMQMQEAVVYEPGKFLRGIIKRFSRGGNGRVDYNLRAEKGQVWIRRLLVTPTKVYFIGPELESSNRITRAYANYVDNFLRVTFVEEDLTELQSAALAKPIRSVVSGVMRPEATPVHDRMKEIMAGFWIGDKKFEFLAFSASQLREKSLWMFASPRVDITAHSIRAWMGSFDAIRNVAKFAARMGQCLSASTPTLDVPSDEVQQIPDIEIFCNGIKYNFSDGIGIMSVKFATAVTDRCLKLATVPSAFQIRYGGYKGVVAQDPRCKATLCLRKSMCKFDSPHSGFEVLNFSKPQACYLNRQIITLLSTLGIEDAVFEQMQDDVLQQLDRMLHDKDVALKVLEVCHSGDTHAAIVAMLQMGYSPADDPYLKGMLHVFRADEVVNLRKKSRILVQKGRMLMGCLDETRTLGADEVFVQVSPLSIGHLGDCSKLSPVYDNDGIIEAYVVTGDVMITRNPCLHPGDVRVCRAVDVPNLRHLKDCVAFSQVGPRPIPSMCSGGDLDGDMFSVAWDPRLIPSKTDAPMDYKPPPEKQLECAPSVLDIMEFHADSAMNQTLGPISNAHLVQADRSLIMARDPKCLLLAELASRAVDFAKTGVPATLPTVLRPTEYPDFMEKEHTEKVYESTSILGKLWRRVLGPELIPGLDSPTRDALSRSFDQALIVEGYEDYLEIAEIHKNWYDKKLMGLMNQYGIERECEICSGRILMLSSAYRKRGGDEKERIGMVMKALAKEVMTYFYEDLINTEKEVNAKVSAYYYVTYHPDYFCKNFALQGASTQLPSTNVSARGSNVHLLSFAWHFWDKLILIKTSRGASMRHGSYRAPVSSDAVE